MHAAACKFQADTASGPPANGGTSHGNGAPMQHDVTIRFEGLPAGIGTIACGHRAPCAHAWQIAPQPRSCDVAVRRAPDIATRTAIALPCTCTR